MPLPELPCRASWLVFLSIYEDNSIDARIDRKLMATNLKKGVVSPCTQVDTVTVIRKNQPAFTYSSAPNIVATPTRQNGHKTGAYNARTCTPHLLSLFRSMAAQAPSNSILFWRLSADDVSIHEGGLIVGSSPINRSKLGVDLDPDDGVSRAPPHELRASGGAGCSGYRRLMGLEMVGI